MSRRLLYMNGLAIIAVVLYHAAGWGFVAMFWWPHRYANVSSPDFSMMYSSTYFGLRAVEQLIAFGIPAFLFVSGFFASFAAGIKDRSALLKYYLVRIRSLLIPYLIWSLIALGLEALLGQGRTIDEYARALLLGQSLPGFYFVPLLCQLYLFAPFLLRWGRNHWKSMLLVTGVIQVGVQLVQYYAILEPVVFAQNPSRFVVAGWFPAGNIFPFVLGMFFGLNRERMLAWLGRQRRFFLIATLVFLITGVLEWELLLRASGETWVGPVETLLDNLYALLVIMTFLAYRESRLPASKNIFSIGSASYGIYLVHAIVLMYVSRVVYHLTPSLLGQQLIFQPILIAFGLGVPLVIMWIVSNTGLKPAYRNLFG